MSKESSAMVNGKVVYTPGEPKLAPGQPMRPGKTNRDKNVTGSWHTHNQNRAANAEVQRSGGGPKKPKGK